MAEEAIDGAVDAATANAGAETPAPSESQPAGGSRTYTEAELDARIKARIDKQNARHAEEMQALQAELEELRGKATEAETKAAELQTKAERDEWLRKASEATGVPAAVLRGDTEEEIMEHAKSIQASVPMYPGVHQQSGTESSPKQTRESIMSIKDDKERLAAIKENIELFTKDNSN